MKQDNQRQTALYAYLAGIIDGEGTIRIGKAGNFKNNPNYQSRHYASISLGMVNKEVLELFHKKFGAKVRLERVPSKRNMWRWGTSGNKIVPKILKKLLPYLIVKHKQAELVLMFCNQYADEHKLLRKCVDCKKDEKIRGYNLCSNCYQKAYRKNTLHKYKINYIKISTISNLELQRREEFYQKVKKLNAVGVAATK